MATLDDIYEVLKDCCAKLGTPEPSAPGTTGADAPGAGMGGYSPEDAENANAAADAYERAREALAETQAGTEEHEDGLRDLREAYDKKTESVKEATKSQKDYSQSLNNTHKAVGGLNNLLQKGIGFVFDKAKMIVSMTTELDNAEIAFRNNAGASKAMADNIGQAYDALRIYGVSIADATTATQTMYSTVTDFSMMSKVQQQELVQTGLLLGEVGISTSDYASAVQQATKTMGMTAEETGQALIELRAAAIDLQMPINELTGAFTALSGEMALLGREGPAVLKELGRISKITGIEMGQLVSMASKFDTFEGAADAAGRLNQMLGGNFLNSMDLLMAEDPAERFMLLRDALDAAGQSFDDLNRFEKIALADAMEVDAATLGKMMSGNMNALDESVGKTAATMDNVKKDAFSLKSMQEVGENMKAAIMPSINALQGAMRDTFEENATTMQTAAETLNKTMLEGTGGFVEENASWLGWVLTLQALMPGLLPLIQGVVSGLARGSMRLIGGVLGSSAVMVGGTLATIYAAAQGVEDGISRVIESGGDAYDQVGVVPLGIMQGIAEGVDYLSMEIFGMEEGIIESFSRLGNESGKSYQEAWEEIDFSYISETWDYIFSNLGESWDVMVVEPLGRMKDSLVEKFDEAWTSVKEYLGIASPSALFMSAGESMVDGLLAPFTNMGQRLQQLINSGMDMLPDFMKNMIMEPESLMDTISAIDMEGATETASALPANAIDATTGKIEAGFQAMFGTPDTAAEASKEPYVLNLSMNMDGREIDKKVVNVVGGIAKAAAYGD